MKIAFDSSVIIAGTHDMHPHHRRAVVWIDAVLDQRITGMITWASIGPAGSGPPGSSSPEASSSPIAARNGYSRPLPQRDLPGSFGSAWAARGSLEQLRT